MGWLWKIEADLPLYRGADGMIIGEDPGICSSTTGERGIFNVTKRDGEDD